MRATPAGASFRSLALSGRPPALAGGGEAARRGITLQSIVTENRARFLEAWDEFFGNHNG